MAEQNIYRAYNFVLDLGGGKVCYFTKINGLCVDIETTPLEGQAQVVDEQRVMVLLKQPCIGRQAGDLDRIRWPARNIVLVKVVRTNIQSENACLPRVFLVPVHPIFVLRLYVASVGSIHTQRIKTLFATGMGTHQLNVADNLPPELQGQGERAVGRFKLVGRHEVGMIRLNAMRNWDVFAIRVVGEIKT